MNKQISRASRRFWVIINYLGIFMILGFFYSGKASGWSPAFTIAILLVASVLVISFIYGFGITHLWKLVHTSTRKLDERQIQVVNRALKVSYSVFAVSILLIVYLYALIIEKPIDVVMAICMLYLAHTLPAAVLAWTEKEV